MEWFFLSGLAWLNFAGLAVGPLVGWLEVESLFGTHAPLVYLAVGCQLECLGCFPHGYRSAGRLTWICSHGSLRFPNSAREGQPQCANISQACICITLTNALLAKASQMAKPRFKSKRNRFYFPIKEAAQWHYNDMDSGKGSICGHFLQLLQEGRQWIWMQIRIGKQI